MNTTPQPDTAKIRQTLNRAFDDTSLFAFCQDYFPEVYNRFGQGMRKDDKMRYLLDDCYRDPTGFKNLLDQVRKEYEMSHFQKGQLKPLIDALEVYIDSLPSNEEEVKDPNVREPIVTKPEGPKITTFPTKSLISSRTKLLVAVVLGVLGFAIMGGLWFIIYGPPEGENPINISVIVAPPVAEWVTQAAETYNSEEHLYEGRKIQVEVIPMPGLKAREKWEDGKFDQNNVPTVWLAESSAWVKQVNEFAAEHTGQDIFLDNDNYRMKRVARSPLVWGIWPEAYQTLVAYFDTEQISWDEMYEAAKLKDWDKMGGKEDSGQFKLMIASPKRDPAGLMAIVGAASEDSEKLKVKRQELEDREFQKWLCTLLDTVVDFSDFGIFNLIQFGRANGDAAHILESDLLTNMKHIQNYHGQSLQIVYPKYIAWFDFPYAVYVGPETSVEEKEAALKFSDYLLTTDQQMAAIKFGLRPPFCIGCPTSNDFITRWENAGVLKLDKITNRIRDTPPSDLDYITKWFLENDKE